MLVLRTQIGDEIAFRELLDLYSPRFISFTRKMMSASPDVVEDLMQEIWVAIFRDLPTLRDVTKFRSWSFRVVRDRIFREFRRRRLPGASLHDIDVEALPAATEPEPLVEPEELQICLNSLSPEHREVLMLRYFEELDYEEVAHATGSTLGTVRSRLYYAKRALRRALEDKLYEVNPE